MFDSLFTQNQYIMKQILFMGIAFCILSVTSCQSSQASLQRAAATSIGNTLSNEVVISNVKRKATSVSWTAKKGDQCFTCEADDMVRRTNCVKTECEN